VLAWLPAEELSPLSLAIFDEKNMARLAGVTWKAYNPRGFKPGLGAGREGSCNFLSLLVQ